MLLVGSFESNMLLTFPLREEKLNGAPSAPFTVKSLRVDILYNEMIW